MRYPQTCVDIKDDMHLINLHPWEQLQAQEQQNHIFHFDIVGFSSSDDYHNSYTFICSHTP